MRKPLVPTPIPNWALALVRNQPLTECVAEDGSVLARGRSQPLKAERDGRWVSIRQGPLVIDVTPRKLVTDGDLLTFTLDLRGGPVVSLALATDAMRALGAALSGDGSSSA